jgi:hypothetical protein
VALKKLDEPLPPCQQLRFKARLSEQLVQGFLAWCRNCIVEPDENLIHIQVMPGDIVNSEGRFLLVFAVTEVA